MNSVMFLGTGGARIMLSTQLLATGGMLIKLDDTFFSLDPGPGALVGDRGGDRGTVLLTPPGCVKSNIPLPTSS
ncbi:MAG: hypothetical protein AB1420_06275 [Bacillota bacterium]